MKFRSVIFILFFSFSGLFVCGCKPSHHIDTSPTQAFINPENDDDFDLESASSIEEFSAQLKGLSLGEFFEVSFKALTMRSPETVLAEGLTDIWEVSGVQLDDISDEYQHQTYAMMAVTLEMLEKYDREALSPEDQVSYDVYKWYLEDQLAGQEFIYHGFPATYFFVTSVHENILQLFTDLHPMEDLQDAEDYVTRLGLVDVKIDQLIEGLAIRNEAGITPPDFAIQWTVYGNLESFVNQPAASTSIYKIFAEKLNQISGLSLDEKQSLLSEAEKNIDEVVLPAYQKLRQYLLTLPTYAGDDSGAWRLPKGEAYYKYRLRHFTTTDLSPDEIHQLGLTELERIHAKMRLLFAALGYPEDVSIIQAYDRIGKDGGHVTGKDVLTTYKNLIEEAKKNLDTAFDIHPETDVVVIGGPTGGYYISASYDGSRPGAFYAAVTGSGEEYYAMPTLAYHEAIPGHHFQIALAQEMKDLPSFRQGLTFTAYTEGWALYAEQLAAESGWYADDPYGHLGFLQAQAFRAARLVVETGLHAKGWTFDQAEKFFSENTGFEIGDSVHPGYQIARYLVWPGQSASYYVGYMKIIELRQRAMDQLGDQFDLKEFHRVVLSNGSMPLELLARVVDQYIAEKSGGESVYDASSDSPTVTQDEMIVSVPAGQPPMIDGTLSPEEWENALYETFSDGSELLLFHSGEYLYLGIRSNTNEMIAGNVFIIDDNRVRILHTSAALGTAIYQQEGDTWLQTQDFNWCCRATYLSESAQTELDLFLKEEGWLSINSRMGTPNELEYQIKIDNPSTLLAVNFLRTSNTDQKVYWPAHLQDDVTTPTPGAYPLQFDFSPDQWGLVHLDFE